MGDRRGRPTTVWRTFAYIVLPPLVVLTGAAPIEVPGPVYGPLVAGYSTRQRRRWRRETPGRHADQEQQVA